MEKKLLLYYQARAEGFKFELRYPDRMLYGRDDLPQCNELVEFIPLWEVGQRIFLFRSSLDRDKAREHLEGIDKTVRRRKRRKKK